MRRRGERGETLAEVLVSTTLLGIIGVGIIGAIAAVLISTDIDRRLSAGETVLRSYVAAIEQARYEDCTKGTPTYTPRAVNYVAPPNYTAQVSQVRFLKAPDPAARPALPPATVPLQFATTCPGADPGVQLIDVEVKSGGARPSTERISFVKRQIATVP